MWRNAVDIARASRYVNANGCLRFEEPGDISTHAIRDEAISWNPWRQNEENPNHPIAIAVEHKLLTC
jgi:hypothetical protein